ncbi:hypothetical protein JTB14_004386 [Gonioctena quinquepunctata]|nr:hypothetical protein JTB14_004386 [Gonioctena quinquepunctata]
MCDNVEWYSGFTEVNIKNNFGRSDVSKLCIGTADSTPQENVGTIDHGIEENGPVESHKLASGLVCKPTGDMRIDLSLSNRSGEFNIASISDNSPKERTDNQTPGIAAADDKGRRNAVPSAGKDKNLKGPSLVRLQHQVYIPPFHGCDFDVPVDIRNSKGVKVCEPLNLLPGLCVAHSVVTIPHHNQNHSKPSIVVRILNISPIPQTINKHTPILTLADVTVLEGQDIPVTKNTIAQVEFNLQHMGVSGREVFQQFLHTYEDIFAKTGKPVEATKVKPIRYLGTEPTLEPIWNRERIRRSQQDDPAVRNITDNVLRNNSQDYYFDLDGVLYRKSEDSRHGDLLVAPTALLPEIMKTYHDLPISGHTGYDKSYAKMKEMFIWPGMSKDIKKEVQTVSGAGLQVARGNKKAGGWGINKSVSASTGEANRSGEKLTTGQPEFPPAEEPTSSGHPREATATTGPPEDFEGPITRTRKLLVHQGPQQPELRQVPEWKGLLCQTWNGEPTQGRNRPGLQIVQGGTHGATVQFLSTHGYGRAESRTGGVLVLSCSIVAWKESGTGLWNCGWRWVERTVHTRLHESGRKRPNKRSSPAPSANRKGVQYRKTL